jgi:NAD(P)-dependent dehydrogenase (short-subunit alcohol dehydrogenase family)
MSGKLEGRKVFLTGASRGIGLEIAKLFLKEGAKIIGAARDPRRLTESSQQLKALGDFQSVVMDLSSPGSESAAVSAVARYFENSLDLLVNNAGISGASHIETEKKGTLEKIFQVNLFAVHNLTQALLPALLKGKEPRIINISSGAGLLREQSHPDIGAYRVSKFALNGLTMNWAGALQGRVAVNALDPGWVKTDLGGPSATGDPKDSAKGALALATKDFKETGKFWYEGKVTAW